MAVQTQIHLPFPEHFKKSWRNGITCMTAKTNRYGNQVISVKPLRVFCNA